MNSKPKVGTVVQVVKSGNRYNAWDADGNKWTHAIISSTRKNNYNRGKAIELREKNGTQYWYGVPMEKFNASTTIPSTPSDVEIPEGHQEIVDFIGNSYGLKPQGLIMKELKWKY